jgi:uncharacterized phage-associated protein
MSESIACSSAAAPSYVPVSVSNTIQAIGVLLRQDGVRCMNYMRLLKLLYIADRESLRRTGRPVVGGPVTAMERGPVLQEVFDLIRGRHRQMPLWDEYLRTSHFNLELVKDPDVGQLSRYEIETLQDAARRHADDDEWALSRLTHEFPEWKKNNPGTSSQPIPQADVLEAVGRADSLQDILEEAAEKNHMESLLGR